MAENNWLELEEFEIQALATSKVYERGRALFDTGMLEELARHGEKISAEYPGIEGETYELSAFIGSKGVREARCSCPYEYEGLCKHLVALLLTWAHTPESFAEQEEQEEVAATQDESALMRELRSRERDELAHIVVQLVETEPKLAPVLQRLLRPGLSTAEVAKTRKAVEALLRKTARRYEDADFRQLQRELQFHVRAAASLEMSRPNDAGNLYATILEALVAEGQDVIQVDDHGSVQGSSTDCIDALHRLLPKAKAEFRPRWFSVVCAAYLFDLDLGGFGFAEGAADALLKANPEEWPQIEQQLDTALSRNSASPKKMEYLHDQWGEIIASRESPWKRASIIELKARWFEEHGEFGAAQQLYLRQGTPEQKVDAYLAAGEFDTATSHARQSFLSYPGLIHGFADKLEQAGQWPRAKQWAKEQNLNEWLAQHSIQQADPEALQFNIELFYTNPSAKQWFQVLELAPEETTENLLRELWAALEKRRNFAVQFDIRLQEQYISEALELWPRLTKHEQQSRKEHFAQTVEPARPDEAITLWNEVAEEFISQRSRGAYQQAVRALVQIQRILKNTGRIEEWAKRSIVIRGKYPRLRALLEEMKKAGV